MFDRLQVTITLRDGDGRYRPLASGEHRFSSIGSLFRAAVAGVAEIVETIFEKVPILQELKDGDKKLDK